MGSKVYREKPKILDLDELDGRTVRLKVTRESGVVILSAIDDVAEIVYVLMIEKDEKTAQPTTD